MKLFFLMSIVKWNGVTNSICALTSHKGLKKWFYLHSIEPFLRGCVKIGKPTMLYDLDFNNLLVIVLITCL